MDMHSRCMALCILQLHVYNLCMCLHVHVVACDIKFQYFFAKFQ